MGKAARLKAQRKADEGAAHVRQQEAATAPAPQELLQEAVIAVGLIFGTEPACAEAGALLYGAALELGYELRPRPVSVLARATDSEAMAFMGPKATAMIADADPGEIEDLRPRGRDNGHLVLTCEDPMLLLDPNIRQLSVMGFDVPSITMRIRSTEPESGDWQGAFADFQIWYMLDEDNDALMKNWDTLVRMRREDGVQLAAMLRSGLSAVQIAGMAVTRGTR